MRNITKIIIHCSATKPSMDIGVDEIRQWHIDRGWSDVGYHHIIRRDGIVDAGRDEKVNGSHAKGHNGNSIGICLVGGIDDDGNPEANFTFHQYSTLRNLLFMKRQQYPDAEILGHRDLPGVTKACPCINIKALIGDL